jgi:hypothetical protein
MTEHRRRLLRILIPWLSLLLLGAAGFARGVPEWKKRQRWENHRQAGNARYTLIHAERAFFVRDLDNNGIRDYWTGDVATLYRYGLIERGLAEADDRPLQPLAPKPVPWHGYFVHIMEIDEHEDPPEEYAQVTDAASGKVHHPGKVAFCLYPAEPGESGDYIFIMDENGSPFRYYSPGPEVQVPRNWPRDKDLGHWSRDCGG